MDKIYIDMPDDLEIENQINFIVEEGLKEKENFYTHIKNMYKVIGLNNLFHDMSELSFVVAMCIGILGLFVYSMNTNIYLSNKSIYAFVFMISPLFYLITNIFSFINMKENNTHQVEMTCKYNIYQITSLRMLVFSVLCMIVNIITILMLDRLDFIKAIMISITSLFLFSTLALYSMLKIKNKVTKYIIITVWIISNGLFSILDIDKYNNFLSSIPIYVYCLVSIGCIYLYLKSLKYLFTYRKVKLEN